jgi:FKBP-type peptidyl-prolyl cis-trans isomerase 2
MRKVTAGERVLVHYVKRFEDGGELSSRSLGYDPLEMTVGTA